MQEAGALVTSQEGPCSQEAHLPSGQGDWSELKFPGRATMHGGDVPNSFSEPRDLIWKEK